MINTSGEIEHHSREQLASGRFAWALVALCLQVLLHLQPWSRHQQRPKGPALSFLAVDRCWWVGRGHPASQEMDGVISWCIWGW